MCGQILPMCRFSCTTTHFPPLISGIISKLLLLPAFMFNLTFGKGFWNACIASRRGPAVVQLQYLGMQGRQLQHFVILKSQFTIHLVFTTWQVKATKHRSILACTSNNRFILFHRMLTGIYPHTFFRVCKRSQALSRKGIVTHYSSHHRITEGLGWKGP